MRFIQPALGALGALAIGLGLVAPIRTARAASAVSEQPAAARLFEEAKTLMAEGQYAEACPKLARSQSLDPQVGTMLNLAYCYENIGKTASSWSMWLEAAAAAASKNQSQREQFARGRAASLGSRLLRLTIAVAAQPGLASIDVQLDGVSVPGNRWGAPTPVDPGQHWVQATAPGKHPWWTKIDVDDRQVPTVSVPVLEAKTAQSPAKVRDDRGDARGSPRRTAAMAVGGAGLAAIAVGAALAVSAGASYASARPDCQGSICTTQRALDAKSRAWTEAGLSTAAFAVGGSALIGGAILWLTGPSPAGRLRVIPETDRSAFGVSLEGAW